MERTRPRIIVNTGDGKGKTTAALGLALRAVGHGKKVTMVQFVKCDDRTGEIPAARLLPDFEIIQTGRGFVPDRQSPDYEKHRQSAREGLETVRKVLSEGSCDVMILDEICTAVALGLVDDEEVVKTVETAPGRAVVVLTGRSATQRIIDLADTVTEMRYVKHGLKTGIPAEEGVEW